MGLFFWQIRLAEFAGQLFDEAHMIISMKLQATRAEIDAVFERIREFGYKVHSIEGEERVVIGVVGVGDVTACLESLEAMPQVEIGRASCRERV